MVAKMYVSQISEISNSLLGVFMARNHFEICREVLGMEEREGQLEILV